MMNSDGKRNVIPILKSENDEVIMVGQRQNDIKVNRDFARKVFAGRKPDLRRRFLFIKNSSCFKFQMMMRDWVKFTALVPEA